MNNLIKKIASSFNLTVLVIVLAVFILYSPSFNAPFKYLDDTYSILNNPLILDIHNAGTIFKESFFGAGHYYRPLVSFSFMLDYHFFGFDSFYWNLESLLIHAAGACLIFLSMSLLLNDRVKGFWIAFIFAVHPIHWEQLTNISGRAILLSGFFVFSAFYFFLLFQKYRNSVFHLAISVIALGAGLLCKESAAMLPIVLGGYLFWIKKSELKDYLWLFPYFFVIAGYILIRKLLGFTATYPWQDTVQLVFGFLTFLSSVILHISSIIFPFHLYFDRSYEVYKTFIDPGLIMTLIIFSGMALFFLRSHRLINPIAVFAVFWFFVELFPVAQLVTSIGVQPGVISTADHFLYVPSVGIIILLVLFAETLYAMISRKHLISQTVWVLIVAGIILSWMLMTLKQSIVGREAISMLTQSIAYNPNNSRVRTSLGLEYARIGRFDLAEKQFRDSLELRPGESIAQFSLAQTLCDQNRFGECILAYEQMNNLNGLKGLYDKNLTQAYNARAQEYRNLIVGDSKNAALYYGLAVAESKGGDVDAAIDAYLTALDLKPDFRLALFDLGSIYEGKMEYLKAAQYYELMLGVSDIADEQRDYARLRLIDLYIQMNMPKRAEKYQALLHHQ